MKKYILTLFIIIGILIVCFGIYWYDQTKILAKPLESLGETDTAFSLKQDDNTITLKMYSKTNIELIHTFYFENNIYTHSILEKVFENKYSAKFAFNEEDSKFTNRKLKDNRIIGDFYQDITLTKDEFYKSIEDSYSNIFRRID